MSSVVDDDAAVTPTVTRRGCVLRGPDDDDRDALEGAVDVDKCLR
jgi:hypothetical protein